MSNAEGKVLKSLVPYAKPVSFQIKLKDAKRPVIEYRSTALFKSAKADESDEEETTEEQNESQPKVQVKGKGKIGMWRMGQYDRMEWDRIEEI